MNPVDDETRLLDPVHEWDHSNGPANAEFTLVEYGDYECPDCAQLYGLLHSLQAELSTRLRLVYRHYPMSGVHRRAQQAAEAAEAAGAQGRFWEMHDILFQNQQALKRDDLVRYAEGLRVDVDRFRRDLKDEVHADRVRKNFIAGVKNGV